jgi:spermidine synthase
MQGHQRTRLLTLCCGLSGAASLIHELVWTRRLELLLGTSLRTAAAVLAVTLGGMALGAALAGKRDDQAKDGARAYASYEVLLALYCLLLPLLQMGMEPLFVRIHQLSGGASTLLRSALSMLLLLPGAMLMGATFPPAVGDVIRSTPGDPAGTLGKIYGANTFGAFLGVLAGGLLLRPTLGTQGTLYVACALSLASGGAAWSLGPQKVKSLANRQRSKRSASNPLPTQTARATQTVYLIYALSGFTALAYEVLLHRMASLWIGGSSYAFAMVLAVFLLGLSIGSALVGKSTFRKRDAFTHLAYLQAGVTLWILGIATVAGQVPILLVKAGLENHSFSVMLALQFLCVTVLLLPGTLCLGATLPTAAACLGLNEEGSAGLVSRLYAVNAVGCVFGSLLAGHLLLPYLGLQGALLATALLNLLAVSVASFHSASRKRLLLLVANLAAAFLVIPHWDPAVLSSGPFMYASAYREAQRKGESVEDVMRACGEVIFQRDGAYATATVRKLGNKHLSLQVNGKTDASTGGDLFTQRLLAHLPLLLHEDPKDVLVIGLGSGVTAGETLRYPIQNLDVVEIAPEVIEASRYFDKLSGAPLADPRTHLHQEDGRAWVQWSERQYDVISSEPSNPWLAGIANLFTQEFFQHCRKRLRPGGVMVQWLQAYSTSPEDFRSIVATFGEAFPQVSLWKSTNQTDFFLLGVEGKELPDARWAIRKMEGKGPLGEHLRSIGLDARRLALSFVADSAGAQSLSKGSRLVTDDDPFLEFTAPRNLYRNLTNQVYQTVLKHSHNEAITSALRNTGKLSRFQPQAKEALRDRNLALNLVMKGKTKEATRTLEKSFRAAPEDKVTANALSLIYLRAGRKLWRKGAYKEALSIFDHHLGLMPQEFEARHLRALCLTKLQRFKEAQADLETVLMQTPHDKIAFRNLSEVLYLQGKLSGALGAFLRSLAGTKPSSKDWRNLADLYRNLGHYPKAALAWRKSLELEPNQPKIREILDLYLEVAGEEGVAKNLSNEE